MEAVKSKVRPGYLGPLAVLLRALVYHPWYETLHFYSGIANDSMEWRHTFSPPYAKLENSSLSLFFF